MAVLIVCCLCATEFSMSQNLYNQRMKDGRKFWCPNGHDQVFTETELDRLRRERDRLKQENARLEQEASTATKQASAARKKVVSLQKRAAAGVCPCCNRTVSQLARHMQTRHPEFNPKVVELHQKRGA